jgi:hypothetical protein
MIYIDTDIFLDELVAPHEYPDCYNSRQQHRQPTQKVASKTPGSTHILNNKSFAVIELPIFG